MKLIGAWLWNILIGVDQLMNALAFGDPDETLSSRMGKAIRANRCVLCHAICWLIGKFDPDEGKDGIVR